MSTSQKNVHRIIVWLRRELRINDNLALWTAVQDAREVIPVYILNPEAARRNPGKHRMIAEGLGVLRQKLRVAGGELIIRTGDPAAVFAELIRETDAAGVYSTLQYHPDVRRSDEKLRVFLEAEGKMWRQFNDLVVFSPDQIMPAGGDKPYTIFTPYRNAWRRRKGEIPPPLPRIQHMRTPVLDPGRIPLPAKPPSGIEQLRVVHTGEDEGATAIKKFIAGGISAYHRQRDLLAIDGTSRFSHHLAIGAISPRTLYAALHEAERTFRGLQREGLDAFLDQIIWREFYYQILAHFPHVLNSSFKPAFDELAWTEREDWYLAWCEGRTGYPIVDAAMRQLNKEGWMHNRGRMITASFLTKDMRIHWKRGEEYFTSRLLDSDIALNNGGWQWCAGSGTDAQPWFRIFNPVVQGKKFDASGAYVRYYVPELARVPDQYIHEPWNMPIEIQRRTGCVIGKQYPFPVVNHEEQRRMTIKSFGALRNRQTVSVPTAVSFFQRDHHPVSLTGKKTERSPLRSEKPNHSSRV
ncbi:MAG TPA: deoxyribodipyrimidine photo-lyase [Bacteroidota bacterium]|nr:deoxyribodipyrimidine photo-lyase [Bacteroidota bacterium]